MVIKSNTGFSYLFSLFWSCKRNIKWKVWNLWLPVLISHSIVSFKLRLSKLEKYKYYFSLRNPLIILRQNLKQYVLVFFLFSRKFLFISIFCCSHSNFFNASRFVIPFIFQIIAFKHIRSLYYFWWS